MSNPIPRSLLFFFFFASLSGSVFGGEVELRWIPPSSRNVAGYNLYVGGSQTALLEASPVNLGRPSVDASNVSKVLISGLDRGMVIGFEMTSYDRLGRESARSNRVFLSPSDPELLGGAVWSEDFDETPVGAVPPDFFAPAQAFKAAAFSDGGSALAGQSSSTLGLVAAEYVGRASLRWGDYDVSGRLMLLREAGIGGIAVRADHGLGSFFGFGGDGSGSLALSEQNKAPLTCESSTSTGVSVEAGVWYRFRLRVTDPFGGARLRAKAWISGEPEPVFWQADCWTQVELPPGSGELALYAEGSGRVYWDRLVVKRLLNAPEPIPYP